MGLVDALLDRTIFYSFDASGFRRHAREFDDADMARSLRGEVCLVSGANSGLGFAIAKGLAARDAAVHMLCRNAERGAAARDAIIDETGNREVHLHIVDISDLASVRDFADRFAADGVDVLVHNAGALLAERELTADGLEVTAATHVVGPFVLTDALRGKLAGGRVVFVSSGGMYSKPLDVETLRATEGPFDGVAAYAYAKRAQVVLSEMLAEALASSDTTVNAMHPGWAATSGVERSLPRFWRLMKNRLRTPEQGADTALWLCVCERIRGETGKFWFDRSEAKTHVLRRTREEDESERRRLWSFCVRYLS